MVAFSILLCCCAQVSQVVSRELEKECVVVFDEAHNIDNVCIEALSVNLRQQTLDAANRNIGRLSQAISRAKATNAAKLQAEYNRLVQGLVVQVIIIFFGGGEGGTAFVSFVSLYWVLFVIVYLPVHHGYLSMPAYRFGCW